MKKKSNFKKKLSSAISLALLIMSGYSIYILYALNMLPMKYFALAITATILVVGLMLLWLAKSKGYFSQVIGFLLVFAMIFASTNVAKVVSLVNKVTGDDTDLHLVHVVVMKDSPYKKVSDLVDSSFGVNFGLDKKNIDRAISEIKKDEGFDVKAENYTSYDGLINALYEGTLEAIIVSDSHMALFEEARVNYAEETRIIKSYAFKDTVEGQKVDTDVSKDTFSVFVTGIDTYGSINSVSRSDVNMIVTVNPVTRQILLTSIPRDYHVRLHSVGKMDKLTHAGIFGVNESMKTLEDLLNENITDATSKIDIDYYLRVNFTSVINIVDALGGVDVYSQYSFKSGAGPSFTKGMNRVNGNEALAFVRERYNLPNGDFDRIKNQQALITGVINKSLSPSIITNFSGFLSSVGEGFSFSMSDKDLNKLIKQQIDTMSSWEIMNIQMTGTGARSDDTYAYPGRALYVTQPNYESVRRAADLIHQMEVGQRISID